MATRRLKPAGLVVLDSSCWLEYLMGTDRADLFEEQLNAPDELIVPVITVYEVIKKIRRELGDDIASNAIVMMQRSPVIDIDLALVSNALSIGLPMADSLIYATAQSAGASLWTQDQHFADLQGVKYFEKTSNAR